MGRVGQVIDDLHRCVPRSNQLLVFIRIQLPQVGAIQGCRVDTKEVNDQLWFQVSKLLQDLVYPVIKDGSLAENISLGFWRV